MWMRCGHRRGSLWVWAGRRKAVVVVMVGLGVVAVVVARSGKEVEERKGLGWQAVVWAGLRVAGVWGRGGMAWGRQEACRCKAVSVHHSSNSSSSCSHHCLHDGLLEQRLLLQRTVAGKQVVVVGAEEVVKA
jgi:hypothetical protein